MAKTVMQNSPLLLKQPLLVGGDRGSLVHGAAATPAARSPQGCCAHRGRVSAELCRQRRATAVPLPSAKTDAGRGGSAGSGTTHWGSRGHFVR